VCLSAGADLEQAQLLVRQGRLLVGVVLPAHEQAPEQAGELAGRGRDRDLMAAAGTDPLVEGADRARLAETDQLASTSARRTLPEPCFEIRPWLAGPMPDCPTLGSSPR
jgi:hypothetical protein